MAEADEADEADADAAHGAVGAMSERILSVIVRLVSVFRRGDDPEQNAAVDRVINTIKKELLPGANAVTVLASAVLEHMLACAFQAKRPATSREFKWLGDNSQVGELPARTTRADLGKSRLQRVGRKKGEQRKAALEKAQERFTADNKKLKDDDAEHWRKLLNVVVMRLLNGPAADARSGRPRHGHRGSRAG